MRPEVLAPTAESSPSIRPLTAITPAGVPAPAKNIFHTPNAARPVSTRAAAIITRRRRRRAGCGVFAAALELSADAAAGAVTRAPAVARAPPVSGAAGNAPPPLGPAPLPSIPPLP